MLKERIGVASPESGDVFLKSLLFCSPNHAAKTVEEATELIKVGFEYHVKIDGFTLFRKRK